LRKLQSARLILQAASLFLGNEDENELLLKLEAAAINPADVELVSSLGRRRGALDYKTTKGNSPEEPIGRAAKKYDGVRAGAERCGEGGLVLTPNNLSSIFTLLLHKLALSYWSNR
jgi:hypothetical protein